MHRGDTLLAVRSKMPGVINAAEAGFLAGRKMLREQGSFGRILRGKWRNEREQGKAKDKRWNKTREHACCGRH
jgi:hypothetical protein